MNRLRKEEDCPGCDLSRANLKHLDLMGVAVNHADLAGADFGEADYSQSVLRVRISEVPTYVVRTCFMLI